MPPYASGMGSMTNEEISNPWSDHHAARWDLHHRVDYHIVLNTRSCWNKRAPAVPYILHPRFDRIRIDPHGSKMAENTSVVHPGSMVSSGCLSRKHFIQHYTKLFAQHHHTSSFAHHIQALQRVIPMELDISETWLAWWWRGWWTQCVSFVEILYPLAYKPGFAI